MLSRELDTGDHRLYAVALPRAGGQYGAAVVVMRRLRDRRLVEVFRELDLGQGYRWSSPDEALRFALQQALDWVICGSALRA